MAIVHNTLAIEVAERRKDGGRIIISTGSPDRDKDRVFPQGGKLENYLRNPVVQWGHNYMDPWATIGRTRTLEVNQSGIVADFEMRPAANNQDPQNIILLLWEQEFVRTASIGFKPETAVPNDLGGYDFTSWDLLEWSLVPIPANQDAIRLAMKSYPEALEVYKRGRVLNATNEKRIRSAHAALDEVLSELGQEDDDEKGMTLEQVYAQIVELQKSIPTPDQIRSLLMPPPPAASDIPSLLTALRGLRTVLPSKEQ